MPSTTIIVSLAIFIVSFLVGILTYYVLAYEKKEKRKKQIEDIISLSINFVIYIWIGKILVNLSKFLTDPLAILAYPSNSYALYIATLFICINLLYRKLRHHEEIGLIAEAFIPVFLTASFTYEFLQLVVEHHSYNLSYLVFLAISTIAYLLLYSKMSAPYQTILFALLLLIGQLILTITSNITIFAYRLLPIYFIILILLVLILSINHKKRKVS
ncbi:MAG TPA: hypothetical protein VFF20_06525 [Pseudogracilibacillus sp.]|nr:hypothetical protein [Pseudogracilibacillus sp.]